MLPLAIEIKIPKNVNLEELNSFRKILIVDRTWFKLPDELAEVFKGSGGNASELALKIQFCYDLKSEQVHYLIEDGVNPLNKYENCFVNQVGVGDLIIKYFGYFNTEVFIEIAGKGGYYLSRLKSGVTLHKKNQMEKWSL
ncbi:MAG: hypothetical protein DRR19_11475 [Candidatus Parabeggiatoa sp. nov. 1]|nr:MAG: hypothetical protein DRR19_11475 [Gammaproteobacteria bacterium]